MTHKFAFESPQITTEAISAVFLPELARHYRVLGTPHLVINGSVHRAGRLTEADLLAAVQNAVESSTSQAL